MKSKPINLSVWMFLKAIPSALLLLYYGMCSWGGYDPTLRYLQAVSLVLAGVIVLWQVSYAKKKVCAGKSENHRFHLPENRLCAYGHCSAGLRIRRFLRDYRRVLCCGWHPLVDNR